MEVFQDPVGNPGGWWAPDGGVTAPPTTLPRKGELRPENAQAMDWNMVCLRIQGKTGKTL